MHDEVTEDAGAVPATSTIPGAEARPTPGGLY